MLHSSWRGLAVAAVAALQERAYNQILQVWTVTVCCWQPPCCSITTWCFLSVFPMPRVIKGDKLCTCTSPLWILFLVSSLVKTPPKCSEVLRGYLKAWFHTTCVHLLYVCPLKESLQELCWLILTAVGIESYTGNAPRGWTEAYSVIPSTRQRTKRWNVHFAQVRMIFIQKSQIHTFN